MPSRVLIPSWLHPLLVLLDGIIADVHLPEFPVEFVQLAAERVRGVALGVVEGRVQLPGHVEGVEVNPAIVVRAIPREDEAQGVEFPGEGVLDLRVDVLELSPVGGVGSGLDRVLDRGGEGVALPLRDRPRRHQGPEVGPGLLLKPFGLRIEGRLPELVDDLVELPMRCRSDAEVALVGFVREPFDGALRADGIKLLLRPARGALLASLVADIGEQLLRLPGERALGLAPEGIRENVALAGVQEAEFPEGDLEAVEFVPGRGRAHVGMVSALELLAEGGLPSGEEELRVDLLLGALPVGLLDDRDLDLRLLGVELGLKAPGQLDGDLKGLGVVVLHRAPVDFEGARVELGVDDAVVPEGRAVPFPELPGVELDDEVAVDLLHLPHAAVPSFPVCPAIIGPGAGGPLTTPRGAFRL